MIFPKGYNSVPPSERLFVKVLTVVLFCFAAAQVSIIISPKIADVGRWIGMTVSLLIGHEWLKNNGHRFFFKQGSVDALIWGLLLAYSLSAFTSFAIEKSSIYLTVCFLQIILFTFMSRQLSLESWRFLFCSLATICIAVAFIGVGGYIRTPEEFLVQGRLAGLGNANSVGLFAMIGLIICTAKFLFAEMEDVNRRKRWKQYYLLGGIGCLVSMLLSGSRGSLGGMIAGVLVVFFYVRGVSRVMLGLFALIPLMPFLNLLVETELKQKIASAYIRGGGGDFLFTRRYIWAKAIEYFKEDPWLGKGYAVHDTSGLVLDGSGYHGMLASVGIVGTALFLSVAGLILVRLFRRGMMLTKQKNYLPGNRELLALGGGCFVALLVQGVGEPWMLGPGSFMHVVFWLSAGACIAGITYKQVPRSEA